MNIRPTPETDAAWKRNQADHTDPKGDPWALASRIERERDEALDAIREQDAAFKLRRQADMRAIKRWQAANPGNDLVWPGRVDMVVWLMEQLSCRAPAHDNHA